MKGAAKTYRYKLSPRPPVEKPGRSLGVDGAEVLDKVVRGQRASDIEERLARALDRAEVGYEFQESYLSPRNVQGEYRLDFAVSDAGLRYAVQPDGEFAHKSAEQKANDAFQDMQFSEEQAGEFEAPPAHWPSLGLTVNGLVARIPGYLLDDQEDADALVQEMF